MPASSMTGKIWEQPKEPCVAESWLKRGACQKAAVALLGGYARELQGMSA
jgi:hypothetical protein